MTRKNNKLFVNGQMSNVQKGFTLLETLIYLVLFVIVIGGGMVAVYNVIESTNASYNHVILQEEANFLFRKIDWALTGLDGSSAITTPSTCSPAPCTSTDLVVTKDSTQLSFALSGGQLTLQKASGTPVTLNASRITVWLTTSIPLFERIITTGKPDAIKVNFTLLTVNNGRAATGDFTFTKYLRK